MSIRKKVTIAKIAREIPTAQQKQLKLGTVFEINLLSMADTRPKSAALNVANKISIRGTPF